MDTVERAGRAKAERDGGLVMEGDEERRRLEIRREEEEADDRMARIDRTMVADVVAAMALELKEGFERGEGKG